MLFEQGSDQANLNPLSEAMDIIFPGNPDFAEAKVCSRDPAPAPANAAFRIKFLLENRFI
jgi:hypothetical protein